MDQPWLLFFMSHVGVADGCQGPVTAMSFFWYQIIAEVDTPLFKHDSRNSQIIKVGKRSLVAIGVMRAWFYFM